MLNKSDKEEIVKSVRADIEKANALFLTNLVGVSGNETVEVRKSVRGAKGKLVVARNTLFVKAAVGTSAEQLFAKLKGPHAVAFAFNDPAAVAKCLKEANDKSELVELKAGLLDGKLLSKAEVRELADMPSWEQMVGTLLATFIAPVSALARVLHAVKEKKEGEVVA